VLRVINKSKSAAELPVVPVHKSLIPKQQAPPVFAHFDFGFG